MALTVKDASVICAVVFVVLFQNLSRAGELPEGMTEVSVDAEKIQFMESAFSSWTLRASVWWYTWLGIYSASAVFSFSYAGFTQSKTTRLVQIVQGSQSLLGAAAILIFPFSPKSAERQFRTVLKGADGNLREAVIAGEKILKKSAETEQFGRSWLQHLAVFAVNMAGALVIWKGFERTIKDEGRSPWKEALITFAAGEVAGELQIWTQPMQAVRDYEKYRKRYKSAEFSPVLSYVNSEGILIVGFRMEF